MSFSSIQGCFVALCENVFPRVSTDWRKRGSSATHSHVNVDDPEAPDWVGQQKKRERITINQKIRKFVAVRKESSRFLWAVVGLIDVKVKNVNEEKFPQKTLQMVCSSWAFVFLPLLFFFLFPFIPTTTTTSTNRQRKWRQIDGEKWIDLSSPSSV